MSGSEEKSRMTAPLLAIRDLAVDFRSDAGDFRGRKI